MLPAFQHIFYNFFKKCKLLFLFCRQSETFQNVVWNCAKLRYFYSPLRPVSLLFCQFRPRVLPVHSAEGGRGHEHALHLVLVENPEEKRKLFFCNKVQLFPCLLNSQILICQGRKLQLVNFARPAPSSFFPGESESKQAKKREMGHGLLPTPLLDLIRLSPPGTSSKLTFARQIPHKKLEIRIMHDFRVNYLISPGQFASCFSTLWQVVDCSNTLHARMDRDRHMG